MPEGRPASRSSPVFLSFTTRGESRTNLGFTRNQRTCDIIMRVSLHSRITRIKFVSLGDGEDILLCRHITILTLRNVDIHLSSLTFPRLLQFCLVTQKGYKVPQVPDVIGFLRGSPLLKNLDLRNARCSYTDEADNHIEPVDLQHLEHASLRGRPSPSHHPLPYIEVDLLPYLRIPPAGRCRININPPNRTLPGNTNYLLTLIRTWGFISGPGGGFGGGAGLTHFQFYIKECLGALTGCLRVEKDEICG